MVIRCFGDDLAGFVHDDFHGPPPIQPFFLNVRSSTTTPAKDPLRRGRGPQATPASALPPVQPQPVPPSPPVPLPPEVPLQPAQPASPPLQPAHLVSSLQSLSHLALRSLLGRLGKTGVGTSHKPRRYFQSGHQHKYRGPGPGPSHPINIPGGSPPTPLRPRLW